MNSRAISITRALVLLALVCLAPAIFAQDKRLPVKRQHSHEALDSMSTRPDSTGIILGEAGIQPTAADSLAVDSIAAIVAESPYDRWEERETEFNPDPTRAVWMSALFPGLGQIYNRRYWKLPIIVGGYMGLVYATSWNNGMLDDYTRAYRDIMDTDPSTNSYMNFFPPNTQESDLDETWLKNVLQSRKNYYRRNRDLCIIAMVGVYLLAMIDAYVDASLSHFDISPELSMDVTPSVFKVARGHKPAFGMAWALSF